MESVSCYGVGVEVAVRVERDGEVGWEVREVLVVADMAAQEVGSGDEEG
jgi:hypothetical protein